MDRPAGGRRGADRRRAALRRQAAAVRQRRQRGRRAAHRRRVRRPLPARPRAAAGAGAQREQLGASRPSRTTTATRRSSPASCARSAARRRRPRRSRRAATRRTCSPALEAARELGMRTIGLTGATGGAHAAACDQCLCFPSSSTPRDPGGPHARWARRLRARRGRACRPDTVFLDRDGTINVKAPEGDYVKSWAEFALPAGRARGGAARSPTSGRRLIVVTNQRGIALGRMTRGRPRRTSTHGCCASSTAGSRRSTTARTPRTGATAASPVPGCSPQARQRFPDIDFARSTVIGDSRRDMEAARAIGARAVFIGEPGGVDADAEAPSLAAAADLVLRG